MKTWEAQPALGGFVWVKRGETGNKAIARVAVIRDEAGFWTAGGAYYASQIDDFFFNSQQGSTSGMDQSLAWVMQLLKDNGQTDFDEAEAARLLDDEMGWPRKLNS